MDGFPRRVSFLNRGVGSACFQVRLLLVLGRVVNCFPKRGVPVKGLEHSRLDDSSQCCICSRHLVMRLGIFWSIVYSLSPTHAYTCIIYISIYMDAYISAQNIIYIHVSIHTYGYRYKHST